MTYSSRTFRKFVKTSILIKATTERWDADDTTNWKSNSVDQQLLMRIGLNNIDIVGLYFFSEYESNY